MNTKNPPVIHLDSRKSILFLCQIKPESDKIPLISANGGVLKNSVDISQSYES